MAFKLNLSYFVALIAGAVVALSVRYFGATTENAELRAKGFELQRLVEEFQPRLTAKRQQLASQQEQLNKGSAISATVGSAVVADIARLADKVSNQRLRDLLKRHGLDEVRDVPPSLPQNN
jgi:hypothetical protein